MALRYFWTLSQTHNFSSEQRVVLLKKKHTVSSANIFLHQNCKHQAAVILQITITYPKPRLLISGQVIDFDLLFPMRPGWSFNLKGGIATAFCLSMPNLNLPLGICVCERVLHMHLLFIFVWGCRKDCYKLPGHPVQRVQIDAIEWGRYFLLIALLNLLLLSFTKRTASDQLLT